MMNTPNIRVPRRERGVVLIFTLIILLILTIGAVALMKSMNISMFSAGNLAFRQDLVNQGEQAIARVMSEFTGSGVLAPSNTTQNNVPADNYSATMLTPNSQGVPLVLLNDSLFAASFTSADIVGATPDVTMRYVIDRMCTATGAPFSSNCVESTAAPMARDTRDSNGLGSPSSTVYRITVRVTGVRGTQVFLQTTFTKPN
jgi:Tfp pilus assembly protein PilX